MKFPKRFDQRRPSQVKRFKQEDPKATPRTDAELDRIAELPADDIWAGWKMLVAHARELETETKTLPADEHRLSTDKL